MSHTYEYTREKVDGAWNLTTESLKPAVEAAFPNNPSKVRCFDIDFEVLLEDEVDRSTLDTVVADAKEAFVSLPAVRAAKIAAIRAHTDGLIAQGAQFDGLTYMSTDQGRFDVLGIYAVGIQWNAEVPTATPGFWPKTVSTTDGEVETEFAGPTEFLPFFQAMLGTYDHWKSTSQVLRARVNAATTVAEVEAVNDDRTWPMP